MIRLAGCQNIADTASSEIAGQYTEAGTMRHRHSDQLPDRQTSNPVPNCIAQKSHSRYAAC
jgi:hypothetical protein